MYSSGQRNIRFNGGMQTVRFPPHILLVVSATSFFYHMCCAAWHYTCFTNVSELMIVATKSEHGFLHHTLRSDVLGQCVPIHFHNWVLRNPLHGAAATFEAQMFIHV